MNDVLQESGGYLIVSIDFSGYVRRSCGTIVHRETESLHHLSECLDSFTEAKGKLPIDEEHAILELNIHGGAQAVWMREDQEPELRARLDKWRSCYGGWKICRLQGVTNES